MNDIENKMSKALEAFNIIRDHCRQRHGACSGCLFELDDPPDSMSRCTFNLGYQPHSWWRLERLMCKPDNPEDVIV